MKKKSQSMRILAVALLIVIPLTASADDLERPYDPVVITGNDVAPFLGASTGDIFVYRSRNGVWEQIEATIRLGGSPTGQPYRVLRWKEGFHY